MKLKPTTKRYLVVGGSVYAIEILIIVIATRLGASNVFAVSLSFWLGLSISFLFQKFITFQDRRTQKRVIGSQLFLYALLIVWNWAFTVAFTQLFIALLPATVCRTIALLVTTIWNFYLYRTKIFENFAID